MYMGAACNVIYTFIAMSVHMSVKVHALWKIEKEMKNLILFDSLYASSSACILCSHAFKYVHTIYNMYTNIISFVATDDADDDACKCNFVMFSRT
jgi:hypothetical protein